MVIADRLRALREEKQLSQGDIEKRTGLLRCYNLPCRERAYGSRPLKRWRKWPAPWKFPLYQLFYDGEKPPELPNLPKRKSSDDIAWGSTGKDARYLGKLRRCSRGREKEIAKLDTLYGPENGGRKVSSTRGQATNSNGPGFDFGK